MTKKRICILADTHGLFDDRIYWKEALSLKKAGYDIYLLFVSEKNSAGVTEHGIRYESIRRETYLPVRILNYLFKLWFFVGEYRTMFRKAMEYKANIYHIQDLRINRIGKRIKKCGHKPLVVYDVHEPHATNILDYRKAPPFLNQIKKLYARYVDLWEKRCASRYDLIIATEINVREQFRNKLPLVRTEIIYNYSDLHRFDNMNRQVEKEYDAIYCGGISELRGAMQILEAVRIAKTVKPDISVLFLGTVFSAALKARMEEFVANNGLTENVILHPPVPYPEVAAYYARSKIGLAVFLPVETHRIILPIKVFEYMMFGLPVVGSNFGHIRHYIETDKAGVAIDPCKPEEIAEALLSLLNDEERYAMISRNAAGAAAGKYRWELMEEQLIRLYNELLTNNSEE